MGDIHAAMHETVAPPDLPDVRAELRRRIELAPPLPDDLRAHARALAPVGRRLLRSGYLAAYRRRRPLDADLLRRWTVVNAAARLAEGIPAEGGPLLRLLRSWVASAP